MDVMGGYMRRDPSRVDGSTCSSSLTLFEMSFILSYRLSRRPHRFLTNFLIVDAESSKIQGSFSTCLILTHLNICVPHRSTALIFIAIVKDRS